ncbi:MAG: OadG family protein [Planctomycetes bacterium]|nr:OadG family protein [Planctomycetota bacterium]
MIEDGLEIMVVGMLTVFGFLWLMVLVMNASAWVLGHWGGDEEPVGPAGIDDGASVAVVIAAVRAHSDRLGG